MRSVEKDISASKSKIHNSRISFTKIQAHLYVELFELIELGVNIDNNIRQIERMMMRNSLSLFK